MREVISDIERWRREGQRVALATVIETWGSAPRGVGAKMAFTPSGQIAGSVSGGCVEGAVYEAGTETLETGTAQLLSFGVADETAWDVGLACGGQIQVFVEPLSDDTYDQVQQWLAAEQTAAVVTVVKGPGSLLGRKLYVSVDGSRRGSLDSAIDDEAVSLANDALAAGRSTRYLLTSASYELEIFVDAILPSPTLVMVGGVHIAVALSAIARSVGYHTIVIDPRRAFGSAERFADVDRLIQAWPGEAFQEVVITPATAVAMLTHDPKIDDPALMTVLPSPAFYVGALGSARTHEMRRRRLLDAGMEPELVNRIHSPIGLDINATTPEEIAVAIMAEIVAARRNGG